MVTEGLEAREGDEWLFGGRNVPVQEKASEPNCAHTLQGAQELHRIGSRVGMGEQDAVPEPF